MKKEKRLPENDSEIQKNKESAKYYLDLASANKELAFQNLQKEERASELQLANKELAYQNQEKENRAEELQIANAELAYQNQEKENRASELIIANKELAFQNLQKEKRAAELLVANVELAYQNQEKENRASELLIANIELSFQNQEKQNLASELLIANKELAFQNQEKEERAAELIIANEELAFQNKEKEKRERELLQANKDLETFAFISSHDLQEPLRKIQTFANRILDEEGGNLSEKVTYYFERIQNSAHRMQALLHDLLAHSRSTEQEKSLEKIDFRECLDAVLASQDEELKENSILVSLSQNCLVTVIPFQFRQLLQNLISNAIKFRKVDEQLKVNISCSVAGNGEVVKRNLPTDIRYSHIRISDTGIGFNDNYKETIFDIFRRLNDSNLYSGTGIGLTIVQKIVENHNGFIFASGKEGQGANFNLYFPFLPDIASEKVVLLE